MSTTRLVVLGAVRVFQPVHGYFLRRELMSWQVDEWANINPGSIYNALQALTREGFLEEVDGPSTDGHATRTTYQLTAAGETEFMTLLRAAMWEVERFDPQPIMASLSFMGALTRQEAVEAFEHRITEIDALVLSSTRAVEQVQQRPTMPEFVREMFDLTVGRLRSEQDWARGLVKRLRDGEYAFSDDADEGPSGTPLT
jgi:DNA-binding PadR family transcriptional regulator